MFKKVRTFITRAKENEKKVALLLEEREELNIKIKYLEAQNKVYFTIIQSNEDVSKQLSEEITKLMIQRMEAANEHILKHYEVIVNAWNSYLHY